jgi:hypothetical protein
MKNKAEFSRFWMDGEFNTVNQKNELDLAKLSAYRRAVSNFVYILTGKNIPVRFSERSTSVTDGKMIYIGGELSKGEVDSTVGLSLHESMHIVKSDFTMLKNLWQKIPKDLYDLTEGRYTKSFVADFVKYILNVVEDRYIDAYAYETAPGYRGYYIALYNKYFNIPKVDKALKSKALRKPTIFAYKFRIVNLVNKNSDLDALPGLREINNILDIGNVLRLEKPEDRLDVSIKICSIIFKNVIDKMNEEDQEKKQQSQNDDDNFDGEAEGESPKMEGDSESSDDNQKKEETGKNETSSDGKDKSDDKKTDDSKMEQDLSNVVEKQDQFINRQLKQKSLDKSTLKKLEELEKHGVEIKEVGEGLHKKVDCIIVKKMTKDLVVSENFPYRKNTSYNDFLGLPKRSEAVKQGMSFGSVLGRKLQVRGESLTTKFSRQNQGKFDKRMIHELGYDMEDVFYRMTTDVYKKAHAHISVDASSSMSTNWHITMKTLVAIAKAASMVNNLDITISFRSAVQRRGVGMEEMPYVVIAYDSKVDNISKISQLFPLINPDGTTPEGLAFESIIDLIPPSSPTLDSYFINISDGEPYFQNGMYSGDVAAIHSLRQIEKLRNAGVYLTSYFIQNEGKREDRNKEIFKRIYGKDSNFINLENITEIAKTLNKKFLQKKNLD